MSRAGQPTGARANGTPAVQVLEVVQARTRWLAEALSVLRAHPLVAGVWLVGSLGRGDGDGFSDVDMIVAVDSPVPAALGADPVAGLALPGLVLYTRPKPRNAPAAGAYLAVCVEMAGLPVLVDLYVWPATTAAVPADGTVLYHRDELRRSPLGLLALLAQHPADNPAGADPDDPTSLLLLIQLAAKYHARGDQPRRAGIYRQLKLSDHDTTHTLRHLLDTPAQNAGLRGAVAAVRRLLDLADTPPRRTLLAGSMPPTPPDADPTETEGRS